MKRLLLILFFAAIASAQSNVTVTQTILSADGTPWRGRVTISNPTTACGSGTVGGSSRTVSVTAGAFSASLAPLGACAPPVAYTVKYLPDEGPTSDAWWTIPASPSTTTINAVQSTYRPSPAFQITPDQISVVGATAGQALVMNGTKYAPGTVSGGGGGGAVSSVLGLIGDVTFTTDSVTEGATNRYFANTLARAAFTAVSPIAYNISTGAWSCPTCLTTGSTTDNLTEGSTNKYVSDSAVRSRVSGAGLVSYNPTTGVITVPDSHPHAVSDVTGILPAAKGGLGIDASALSGCVTISGGVASAVPCPPIYTAGSRILIAGNEIGMDGTEVGFITGAGAPTGACTTGADRYTDTTAGVVYDCIASAWVRAAKYSELPSASTGDVVGPASSTNGQLPVFSGTTGKLLAGLTGTGLVKIVNGVPSVVTGTASDHVRVDGTSEPDATGGGGGGSVTGLYSGALDFGSIPDGGCASLTFAATGITTGKALAVAAPSGLAAGLLVTAFVSAADTVKVTACNISGAAVDPASGTYAVRDLDSLGYLTASATINYGSIPDGGCSTDTITVTGAATGDNVAAGWPSTLDAGLTGTMLVTAANTVTARLCNFSGAAVDPASATFKAAITK